MRAICAVFVVCALAVPAAGQTPVFQAVTDLVPVHATVRTADRRPVTDLTSDDFELLEDGHPRPIAYFSRDAVPVTAVVLLDTSASMTRVLPEVRAATRAFLQRMTAADRVRLGAFNDGIQIADAFSGDQATLQRDLRRLESGGATRLYDALDAALDLLASVDERRVILVLSDGSDTASGTKLSTLASRAQDAGLPIYAIGLQVVVPGRPRAAGGRGRRALETLAADTGGGTIWVDTTSDLRDAFTRVADDIHRQFVIGFTPARLDGRAHRVDVRMRQEGLTVRARRSYVALAPPVSAGVSSR